MNILDDISEFLQQGKVPKVKELVQQALDEGIEPKAILEEGLLKGMGIIGGKFKNNEVFIPQVLIAARAMNAGVEIMKPVLISSGVKSKGVAVIGTVKGDLHDIGKNLVKLMIESKGITVIDLGIDVPPERFVEATIENNASIVCCSSLLTNNMMEMANVIKALEDNGIREKVKVMVGGAPVTQEFCDKIGADCYTVDASSAAEAALSFCA